MAGERFGHSVTEEEIELLVEQRHSKSTKSVFKVADNLLSEYTKCDKQYALVELYNEVSVTELDFFLRKFFINARKRDGERYCRKSMLTIRFGLQQLFKKKRAVDIINDDRFGKCRDAFKAVLVQLKKEGKGETVHKDVISDLDIEKLYKAECMSTCAPASLLNKVIFDYMLHFCNRGRENLRDLRKDDFSTHVDGEGRTYITMKSKLTKNRREDDDDFTRSNRIYANEVAKGFTHSLKRQSGFVQLAQTSRTVLTNQEVIGQMSQDIADVDFVEIFTHAGFMEPSADSKLGVKLYEFFDEFRNLLTRQSAIESYTEWLDNIIDACVLKPSEDDMDTFKTKAAEFLLQWGAFGALLMRDLTLCNSSSFGAFHLLHIMLDEYVFLVVETRQEQEVERGLQARLQRHMQNAEEIQTQAKVRNSANKTNSPKGRKRRHVDDYDSDTNNPSARPGKATDPSSECTPPGATAFTRPHPARDTVSSTQTHDPSTEHPSRGLSQGPLAISPLKPYQAYGPSSYDRPTYLPQFGIGSHSDYVGPGSVFGPGRFPSYSESYSQPFSSNPFSSSISPVTGSYWADGRGHHSLTDTYQPYGYNKLSAPYDNWNKGAIFRGNSYQDGLTRPAFDTRPYYRSSHDNLQVGPPVAVGAYSGNFMDIAPSGAPYCRQDGGVLYQDDIYPVSMATPFGKSYLSGPFR